MSVHVQVQALVHRGYHNAWCSSSPVCLSLSLLPLYEVQHVPLWTRWDRSGWLIVGSAKLNIGPCSVSHSSFIPPPPSSSIPQGRQAEKVKRRVILLWYSEPQDAAWYKKSIWFIWTCSKTPSSCCLWTGRRSVTTRKWIWISYFLFLSSVSFSFSFWFLETIIAGWSEREEAVWGQIEGSWVRFRSHALVQNF